MNSAGNVVLRSARLIVTSLPPHIVRDIEAGANRSRPSFHPATRKPQKSRFAPH
jgi:hypothetical protein